LAPHDVLTPGQRRIGAELGTLVEGPSPAASARLLAAVRAAHRSAPQARRLFPIWRRVALVGAGLLVLAGGGVGTLAASSQALPGSPGYAFRLAGERLRLTFAGPTEKERLRIQFASDRLQQAATASARGDKNVAKDLLHDAGGYLHDANDNVNDATPNERGAVQDEIHALGAQQQAEESQVDQQGQHQDGPASRSMAPGGQSGGQAGGQQQTGGTGGAGNPETQAGGTGSGSGSSSQP